MKRTVSGIFLLLLCCGLYPSPCGGWVENLMIEEPNRTIVVQGHFREEPWGAFPGELVFSYEIQSPQSNHHEKYYFQRVQEEGSVEIRHTWAKFGGFRAGRPDQEILKVPFKEGGEYPLPMKILTLPGCPPGKSAVLKMLLLKDNRLGYRIILPDCLKEALKKEQERATQP